MKRKTIPLKKEKKNQIYFIKKEPQPFGLRGLLFIRQSLWALMDSTHHHLNTQQFVCWMNFFYLSPLTALHLAATASLDLKSYLCVGLRKYTPCTSMPLCTLATSSHLALLSPVTFPHGHHSSPCLVPAGGLTFPFWSVKQSHTLSSIIYLKRMFSPHSPLNLLSQDLLLSHFLYEVSFLMQFWNRLVYSVFETILSGRFALVPS